MGEMTSYSQLEKKLRRACLDSDLSDEETIARAAASLNLLHSR